MRHLLQTLRIMPCARIRTDPVVPQATRLLGLLDRASHAEADLMLSAMPAEVLDLVMRRSAEASKARALAARWHQTAPGSRHARLLMGEVEIRKAWDIRGESYMEDISERRRRQFPEVMAVGYQHLLDLATDDPTQALAYARLMHCSVVIGVGDANRGKWLDRAMEVAPFHLPTLNEYLRGTKARWGGSEEEMFGFAGWVTGHAPAGHVSHIVAAHAVIEKAFSVTDTEVDVLWLARGLCDDALADWLREALYRWAQATPATLEARLAETAAERAQGYGMVCLEHFALACYLAGAKPEARLLLAALQGQILPYPWEQFAPYVPPSGRLLARGHRVVRLTHDRICRDLALDPRQVVANA